MESKQFCPKCGKELRKTDWGVSTSSNPMIHPFVPPRYICDNCKIASFDLRTWYDRIGKVDIPVCKQCFGCCMQAKLPAYDKFWDDFFVPWLEMFVDDNVGFTMCQLLTISEELKTNCLIYPNRPTVCREWHGGNPPAKYCSLRSHSASQVPSGGA